MSLLHFLRYRTFEHDDLRDRDEDGKAILICKLCGKRRSLGFLAQPAIRGPQAEPKAVKGQPLQRAMKVEGKVMALGQRKRA
jgi:hypothetical protein